MVYGPKPGAIGRILYMRAQKRALRSALLGVEWRGNRRLENFVCQQWLDASGVEKWWQTVGGFRSQNFRQGRSPRPYLIHINVAAMWHSHKKERANAS